MPEYKGLMKLLGNLSIALLILASSSGCSTVREWMGQPGPDQPANAPRPASTKLGDAPRETFTGQVVLLAEGYRFRPNDNPDDSYRLTRATRPNELVNLEVHLRKYYGKTITVRGRKQDGWLWEAAVIGQWVRPGESTGPNTTAPPEPGQ